MSLSPIGKCKDMCSASERKRRERERRLHKFEILQGTELLDRPKSDDNKTVAEFQRSAAGRKLPEADKLRPPRVLRETMIYLIEHILSRDDEAWIVVYDFIFDRVRAVRQELIIQQIWNFDSINVLEIAVRFYIYAANKARESPSLLFNHHLNYVHLQECLKQLLKLYQDSKKKSAMEEMITFYLLHNMNSFESADYILSLPEDIRCLPNIKSALEIYICKMLCNYKRIFKLIVELPPLQACATVNHIEEIRREALQVMNTAYSSPNCKYPVDRIVSMLMFKNEKEATMFCSNLGIQVIESSVQFLKKNFKPSNINDDQWRVHFIEDKLRKINIEKMIIGGKKEET